jgi:phosphate transport system permease protein
MSALAPTSPLARPRRRAVLEPRFDRFRRGHSRLMRSLCIAFTLFILFLLTLVILHLVSIGGSFLSLQFFTQLPIPPGMEGAPGGMYQALVGTGLLILMASAVGIPVGLLGGIFLAEYSANSPLATITRFIADVLAGVPSIVVGILGYELLVVPLGNYSGMAGALALAFIMIPIVARTTEEMLRLVPHSYREASIALGATKAGTILRVVLPAATGSVVTGIMLAMARVAGETAPLLFTALGSRLLTLDPRRPFPSLTVQIFDNARSPDPAERGLAWAGILILIALIFVLNLLIRLVVARSTKHLAT